MSFRLIASVVIFLTASFISSRGFADEDEEAFHAGISIPGLARSFPSIFADVSEGIRFASCYSLDPDAGGPAEAFLVFLPPGTRSRYPDFDAVFFWVGTDQGKRYLQDFGVVELLRDDMFVTAVQGGNWINEAMERTTRPLLSAHPRVAHSPEEIFQRPRRRCRYSPASNWHDGDEPKPRRRPKIRPEWFASK